MQYFIRFEIEESGALDKVLSLVGKQEYAYILHDKDVNKTTGEVKRAHYHMVCNFEDGTKHTKQNFIKKLMEFGVNAHVETCRNEKACLRYLFHLDHPDKAQYAISECVTNIEDIKAQISNDSTIGTLGLLMSKIENEGIRSMRELVYLLISNGESELINFVKENAYFINCIMRDSTKER